MKLYLEIERSAHLSKSLISAFPLEISHSPSPKKYIRRRIAAFMLQ